MPHVSVLTGILGLKSLLRQTTANSAVTRLREKRLINVLFAVRKKSCSRKLIKFIF